jgi:hypothetical protein
MPWAAPRRGALPGSLANAVQAWRTAGGWLGVRWFVGKGKRLVWLALLAVTGELAA